MRRALVFALAVTACSGGDEPPATTPVTFDMSLTVPAHSETHRCQFVTMPVEERWVVELSHTYTTGSHHLLLFRTDVDTIPPGMEGQVDCYEGDGSIMSHVRGILYGSQISMGGIHMPQGVGLKAKAGEVLLLQSHYVNTGDTDLPASVHVDLQTRPVTDVLTPAGVLFFYDPFIFVPIAGTARASMRCLVPQNITLFAAFAHYHKRGVSFEAFLDPTADDLAPTPFYTSESWEHPEALAAPMDITAGSRVRFNCLYDNLEGTIDYVQGQSAELNEMCVFSGIYYPAMSLGAEFCFTEPDMFGTGDKTCGETLACVQACPPGSAPLDIGAGQFDIDPCWQKCFVDSCPKASAPIFDGLQCIASNCGDECAQGASECVACATSMCLPQITSCYASTCQ